jgi:hypothetical protein
VSDSPRRLNNRFRSHSGNTTATDLIRQLSHLLPKKHAYPHDPDLLALALPPCGQIIPSPSWNLEEDRQLSPSRALNRPPFFSLPPATNQSPRRPSMSGHAHHTSCTASDDTHNHRRPKHRDTAIGGKLEGRRAPPSGVCGRLKAATQRRRSGGRLELDHAGGIALACIGHGLSWAVVLPLLGRGLFDVVE